MCGIAGLIHKGETGQIGKEMTSMLQALKHRGPDSTGFALYGPPDADHHVMRFKVAEQDRTYLSSPVPNWRKMWDEYSSRVPTSPYL